MMSIKTSTPGTPHARIKAIFMNTQEALVGLPLWNARTMSRYILIASVNISNTALDRKYCNKAAEIVHQSLSVSVVCVARMKKIRASRRARHMLSCKNAGLYFPLRFF
jgi:hypothetical protein